MTARSKSHLMYSFSLHANLQQKLSGRTIDVAVDDEKETYSVHENFVCGSSPFFDRAMTGTWRDSLERAVQLPDEEPEIFALYVH
jgi:hypothetical protein